jgi:hypothetical protein
MCTVKHRTSRRQRIDFGEINFIIGDIEEWNKVFVFAGAFTG